MEHVKYHHDKIAEQKIQMFRQHSHLFPESRGRCVFIGDYFNIVLKTKFQKTNQHTKKLEKQNFRTSKKKCSIKFVLFRLNL